MVFRTLCTYIKVNHRLEGGPKHILKQLEVTFLGRNRGSSKELLTENNQKFQTEN